MAEEQRVRLDPEVRAGWFVQESKRMQRDRKLQLSRGISREACSARTRNCGVT
jgi:hypothetical protein